MTEFDDDIPIPDPQVRQPQVETYPELRAMQPGQSFFVEGVWSPRKSDTDELRHEWSRLQGAISRERRRGYSLTSRRWEQDGKVGTRIWRTA